MPARKRSDVPLENVKHGPMGYKMGCGCETCRASNRRGQARKRENDKVEVPPEQAKAVERSAFGAFEPGSRERLVTKALEALKAEGPEAEALTSLAIMNARLIDTLPETGKWHLLSPTVRTLRDLMRELKAIAGNPAPEPASGEGEGDEGDFAASLRPPGES